MAPSAASVMYPLSISFRPDDCIEVIKLYSIVWDLELASPPETYSIKVMTSFIQVSTCYYLTNLDVQ